MSNAWCRLAIIIELGIQNWIDAAILFAIQMTNATIGWCAPMALGLASMLPRNQVLVSLSHQH